MPHPHLVPLITFVLAGFCREVARERGKIPPASVIQLMPFVLTIGITLLSFGLNLVLLFWLSVYELHVIVKVTF